MSKHYFKIKNHELFGGEGTEGYMGLEFDTKEENIGVKVTKEALYLLGVEDSN